MFPILELAGGWLETIGICRPVKEVDNPRDNEPRSSIKARTMGEDLPDIHSTASEPIT